jgi:hypothetical protein
LGVKQTSHLTTYSGLIFAARITFAHFSASSAINFPNSVGVSGIGVGRHYLPYVNEAMAKIVQATGEILTRTYLKIA